MKGWTHGFRMLALGLGLALLASCGGGGGGATGDAAVEAVVSGASTTGDSSTGESTTTGNSQGSTGDGAPRHQLFVSDSGHGVVAMFDTLDPTAGSTVSTENTLTVPGLVFDGPLAYDSGRDLLYTISNDRNVFVYANAGAMDAGAAPARTIALPQPLFGRALYLDKAHDVLYVGGEWGSTGKVFVYANASAASGAVAPTRSLDLPQGLGAMTIDVERSIMYTLNLSRGPHVFTGLAAASGAIVPSREVTLMGGTFRSIAIDAARDRLYVTDSAGVHIIGSASTDAARLVGVVAIPGAYAVAVDAANDRLYVGSDEAAYIFNQASSLAGGTTAAGTAVAVPNGTFLRAFAFP
ncbi:MAG: hypothetical protein JWQ76_3883 [Ramlibacter sp.]|nr:hypothetical protein [Ramlibacter sp.]